MYKEIALVVILKCLYAHSVLECDFEEENKCEWQFTTGPGQAFAFHIENGRRQGPTSKRFSVFLRRMHTFSLANSSSKYIRNKSEEEVGVVKSCIRVVFQPNVFFQQTTPCIVCPSRTKATSMGRYMLI